MATFKEQVRDILEANGWESLIDVELVSEPPQVLRVRLAANHRTAPGDVVNVYTENVNPPEQVQSECLRALRTGRPGA